MGLLTWIIIGLIAGFIAEFLVGGGPGGIVATLLIGIAGAVIGGFISQALGYGGLTGFNLRSLIIATIGAILLIFLLNLIRRPRHRLWY